MGALTWLGNEAYDAWQAEERQREAEKQRQKAFDEAQRKQQEAWRQAMSAPPNIGPTGPMGPIPGRPSTEAPPIPPSRMPPSVPEQGVFDPYAGLEPPSADGQEAPPIPESRRVPEPTPETGIPSQPNYDSPPWVASPPVHKPTPWQQAMQPPPDWAARGPITPRPAAPEPDLSSILSVPNAPGVQGVGGLLGGAISTVPKAYGAANEMLRRNVPGYAGHADIYGNIARPIVGKVFELAGNAMQGYQTNVLEPLAEAMQLAQEGGRPTTPYTWQELAQLQEKRPERMPGEKMIRQGMIDPLNVLPLPIGKIPALARMGIRAGREIVPGMNAVAGAAREAMPAVAQATRGLARTMADETGSVQLGGKQPENWYFSQLQRTIETKVGKSIPVNDLRGLIHSAGVKPDEMKWTGFDDWLNSGQAERDSLADYMARRPKTTPEDVWAKAAPKGVSKEAALRFLQENNVQVQEVLKGGPPLPPPIPPNHVNASSSPEFFEYQEPGGQNYRELLLTLPWRPEHGTESLGKAGQVELFINGRFDGRFASETDARRIADAMRANPNLPPAQYEIRPTRVWTGLQKIAFQSSHFDDPNILAHVRFNERVDAEGKKVLFIEEIQSDWEQAGRKEGYADQQAMERARKDVESIRSELKNKYGGSPRWMQHPDFSTEDANRLNTASRKLEEVTKAQGTIPSNPFEDRSTLLALKRMLRWAAENDFDQVAWTPGSVHTKRWGTERIAWSKHNDGFTVNVEPQIGGFAAGIDIQGEATARGLIKKGKPIFVKSLDELKRVINETPGMGDPGAREIAENRTIADKLWKRMQATDEGVMMPRKEGLEASYDTIIPQTMNAYAKKWGAKVEETRIATKEAAKDGRFQLVNEDGTVIDAVQTRTMAEDIARERGATVFDTGTTAAMESVHAIDVTPSMKASVMEGQPLFQFIPGAVGAGAGYDPNASPEENLKNMAISGSMGLALGMGARRGKFGLSVEDISKGKQAGISKKKAEDWLIQDMKARLHYSVGSKHWETGEWQAASFTQRKGAMDTLKDFPSEVQQKMTVIATGKGANRRFWIVNVEKAMADMEVRPVQSSLMYDTAKAEESSFIPGPYASVLKELDAIEKAPTSWRQGVDGDRLMTSPAQNAFIERAIRAADNGDISLSELSNLVDEAVSNGGPRFKDKTAEEVVAYFRGRPQPAMPLGESDVPLTGVDADRLMRDTFYPKATKKPSSSVAPSPEGAGVPGAEAGAAGGEVAPTSAPEAPVVTGKRTAEEIYDAAREAAGQASREFRTVQLAYRAKQIDDAAFLAGKAKHDAAMDAFDKDEQEFINATNAAAEVPPAPKPEAPPVEAVAKQPWDMTKDEWENQPSVVWRGDTGTDIRHTPTNEAIYFAKDKTYAATYGEPQAAIVSVSKPFDAQNGNFDELTSAAERLAKQAESDFAVKKGAYPSWEWDMLDTLESAFRTARRNNDPAPILRSLGEVGTKFGSERFAQVLKEAGYDGLVMNYGKGPVIAAISPEQVTTHRSVVEAALARGEDIRPEVLAEYGVTPKAKGEAPLTEAGGATPPVEPPIDVTGAAVSEPIPKPKKTPEAAPTEAPVEVAPPVADITNVKAPVDETAALSPEEWAELDEILDAITSGDMKRIRGINYARMEELASRANGTPTPLNAIDEAANVLPVDGAGAIPIELAAEVRPTTAKLPPELSKASPGYGSRGLTFESDIDRALYIVANKKVPLSAGDQKYMDWLKGELGLEENEVRAVGQQVRAAVKSAASKTKDKMVMVPQTTLTGIPARGGTTIPPVGPTPPSVAPPPGGVPGATPPVGPGITPPPGGTGGTVTPPPVGPGITPPPVGPGITPPPGGTGGTVTPPPVGPGVTPPGVTPPVGPSVVPPRPPRPQRVNAITPPKKAGHQQLWNRSRNVIESMGQYGKGLGGLLRKQRNVSLEMAGKWTANLPTAHTLKGKDFENFVDVAEGNAVARTPRIQQAVDEWRAVRLEVYNAAQAAGIPMGYLDDYFPHVFDPKMFKGDNWVNAVNHLRTTGQAATIAEAEQMLRSAQKVFRERVYGNLQRSRTIDLPGYEKTPRALFGYIEHAADKIAQVQVMGEKDKIALRLITKLGAEGYDADAAKHLFDIAIQAQPYGDLLAKAANAIRSYNVITKMGVSVISNAGQPVNIVTVAGALRTIKHILGAMFSSRAADEALRAGTILDGTLMKLREGAGWTGTMAKVSAPAFNIIERFNRILASEVGIDYAQSLVRKAMQNDQYARQELTKMGLDPQAIVGRGGTLTHADRVRAAQDLTERTQFYVDPQDLPGWASSPVGKILMQFRTFSYNQTAFIGREILGPAIHGNVWPLTRLLLFGLPVGAIGLETTNFLRNRISEEDPTKRIIQYYQKVGGLGILGDLIVGLNPMDSSYLEPARYAIKTLGALGGPTSSTIIEGLETVPGAFNINKSGERNLDPLKRFGWKQLPVVGPTLMNTFVPYKTRGSRTSPVNNSDTTLTPFQRRLQGANETDLTLFQKRLQNESNSDLTPFQKRLAAGK